MIRLVSRHSVRHAWPAYVGAFVALTFGVVLIGLAVTLIGAVEATASTDGVTAGERAELDGLSSLFGTMSAVAMFMALFVVGSTFGFVVASRRRELGLLRLVGATPRQVRRVVLGESAVVAAATTVVGCLVSTAVAPGALWLCLLDFGSQPSLQRSARRAARRVRSLLRRVAPRSTDRGGSPCLRRPNRSARSHPRSCPCPRGG